MAGEERKRVRRRAERSPGGVELFGWKERHYVTWRSRRTGSSRSPSRKRTESVVRLGYRS